MPTEPKPSSGLPHSSRLLSAIDLTRDVFSQTLGKLAISKEAAESVISKTLNRLVERGRLKQDEVLRLSAEFKQKIDKNRVDIELKIDNSLKNAFKAIRIPSRDDIVKIQSRLDTLEKNLKDLEKNQ